VRRFALAVIAAIGGIGCAGSCMAEEPPRQMDQVVVRGERLHDLRRAVNKARERLVREYNRVNQDRRQAVSCKEDAATGTRLSRSSCSTYAQRQALEQEVSSLVEGFSENAALQDAEISNRIARTGQATPLIPGMPLTTLAPPEHSSMAERPDLYESTLPGAALKGDGLVPKLDIAKSEFEANFARLLHDNPRLRQRYEEYQAARRRLDEASRR
jgi:hypothetical protein